MKDNYIRRSLEPAIKRAASGFPSVILTGSRQSGKTILLQGLFHEERGYVSLDVPDVRAAAHDGPMGFLAMYPAPVIFDEVRNVSDLLSYIRGKIGPGGKREASIAKMAWKGFDWDMITRLLKGERSNPSE